MAPRRILVTGAGGFVGGHLLPALRGAFPDAGILTPACDVTVPDDVAAAVRLARPDACVHLAAVAAIPAARQDPDRAWRVNLHGTLNLARAVAAHAPGCVLLFPGSADAYGAAFRSGRPVDESRPLAPLNAYGATKAAAELALHAMAADGLRAILVRPFNHTGPGQTPDFVVPAFARQVARIAAGRQDPVLRVGALDPLRDFLDVRDVCAAYVACLDRADALPTGVVMNVASGVGRRVGDVLDALIEAAGITARIETDAARLRPSDIPAAIGEAGLARRLLGWEPRIPWDQTMRDVLDDWRGRVAAET